VYSIIITGYIPVQKSKEFNQHMRQMIGLPNNESVHIEVFQDMMNKDLYQVKIVFKDKESMFLFLKSDNHAMISGSFKALGMLRDQHLETYSDLKETKL